MINTASKLVLGIIGVLVILWWFRYDYITAGQGFIFRIDRFTQTTSVADVSDKEWESIQELPPKPATSAEAPIMSDAWADFDKPPKPPSPAEAPSASSFLDDFEAQEQTTNNAKTTAPAENN